MAQASRSGSTSSAFRAPLLTTGRGRGVFAKLRARTSTAREPMAAGITARVAAWHRWLGLILTLPLLAWLVSSAAMMMVTMKLPPSGLAGSYRLNPYNSMDVPLASATMGPTPLLQRLAREHRL